MADYSDILRLARLDGFPSRIGIHHRNAPWDGRLAERCSDRLEAVVADARRQAALLWAEHAVTLREAGKEPWFLNAGYRAQRSCGTGANQRPRSCVGCSAPIPATGKRGRPRLRCPDRGGAPWRTDEMAA